MCAKLLEQNEKPFNLIEAAEYLGVSKSCLYKLTSSKQITFYKPNRKKIYFKLSDLKNWLFRNKSESSPEIQQAADHKSRKGN
jgi:excisionase family DNA binding protein